MIGRPRRVGLLTAEPSRLLLSQAVLAGLDFVVLDAEQTGLDARECSAAVLSLSGSDTEVVIRVPDLDERTLVTFANTGAHELLLPQVRQLSQLEAAYRATRFPPDGTRSRQVSAASSFGTDFSRPPRLSVLIETVEAVEAAEQLASCRWIDSAWIGPTDLSDDIARQRPVDAGSVERTVRDVVTTFLERGASIGLPAGDAAGVKAAFERGADRVAVYWERHVGSALADMAAAAR